MRYERLKDIVRLAVRMQGAVAGLTLDDIRADLSVSRWTAQRLRDTVDAVFGPLESVGRDAGKPHWRLRSNSLTHLAKVSAEELAELTAAGHGARADTFR